MIFDYLGGREQFDSAAVRLAAEIKQVEKGKKTPPPGFPDVGDEDALHGHMVWFPLEIVPKADRPRASALIQRAFELLDNGEAA